MGALTDMLSARLQKLRDDRARIVSNHTRELAQVDNQIAALQAATAAITDQVEATYQALLQMGLINPVNR